MSDLFGNANPDERMVVEELKRELAMRRDVYPRWIERGKIDPTTAEYRIRCLEVAIQLLTKDEKMPQIIEIANQPCEVKDIKPRVRMNGDTRERTAGFTVLFNYSPNILSMLSYDGQAYNLGGLWDDEGNPTPGIKKVEYDREFGHYKLIFSRNRKAALTFTAEKLHTFKTKPEAGEMFKVEFQALGVCSEGDTERLHKLVKDPGITLSIEVAPGGQEEA